MPPQPTFTLGIEEEFQVVDPETRELRSHIAEMFAEGEKRRNDEIVYDLQMVARANLIFGLHVHVAIEDPETRIQVMNAARYFLPHVFALSVNSPFWCGRNTGWKSYRAKVFERFPRTGIPDYFRGSGEFDEYVQF